MSATRNPASQHCKVIVQLDESSHVRLAQLAEANDRTIRDQARFMLKRALGVLPKLEGNEQP